MTKSFILFSLFIVFSSCNKNEKLPVLESKILGKGSPTIIFENGMASTYETWKSIPDSISKTHRVLLYNRAGLGNSETTKSKRSIPNMVGDLENLLEEKNIEGPYILVAHSMGSYLTRYFAINNPDDVAGILLVDPSPDKMYDAYTEKETLDFLKIGDENFKDSNSSVKAEWENYLDNRKFIQTDISDKIPMIILSATQWDFYDFHKSILNKNEQTKHLKIEGSHDLHHDKPELIIKEIRSLIK